MSGEQYGEVISPLTARMIERLHEKSVVFGIRSWRDSPFDDPTLMDRLRRAVQDLEMALRTSDTGLNQDVLTRAADVANLAMMAADPERVRTEKT
jgi:hypothetical protein